MGSSGSARAEGGNVLIYSEFCITLVVYSDKRDICTMKDLTPDFVTPDFDPRFDPRFFNERPDPRFFDSRPVSNGSGIRYTLRAVIVSGLGRAVITLG